MAKERERQAFRQISIFDPPEPTEPKPSWSEPAEIKADRPEPTEQKPNQLKQAEKGEYSEFRPGTAIWLNQRHPVFAEKAFIAKKLPGQKWARASAYKLRDNTVIYYYEDWEGKLYRTLLANRVVGIIISQIGYKPKPIK